MSHVTASSRRKWTRRGRYLADFLFGFTLAGTSHVLNRFAFVLGRQIAWTIRHFRKDPKQPSRPELQDHLDAAAMNPRVCQADAVAVFKPLAQKPNVRFTDVAGLEDAKREVMLRLVLPMRYPRQAQALGIRRGGGLLLFGPPGTGKTLLARAVASELDCPFYHIRPSNIMSGQVGQAEKNIHRLFQTVRAHPVAVLFFDELESLVPSRRRNGSTIMARAISQFLSEVDGLDSDAADGRLLLIGATNEPDMLDEAVLRPGRFDVKVCVGPPNAGAREQILRSCLNHRPIAPDVHVARLVETCAGMTGAEVRGFVDQAADRAFLRSIGSEEDSVPILRMEDFALEGLDTRGVKTDGSQLLVAGVSRNA